MKQGWEIKKLGEVCENVSNINWKTISLDTKLPYIDLSAVDRDNSNIDDFEYINKDNAPSRAKQIVNTGDVIFATTRPLLKRVCVITKSFNNAIASTGFCVLRPKGKVVSKWIYYILKSDSFYIYIEPLQKGISYPAVSDNEVKNFSISVPPLAEQEHIVAELDLLSGIIEKQKQQLKEYDTLAQSIFYTMFGDPITNEKGWEVLAIDNVCSSIVRGPFGSALKKDFFVEPSNDTYKVYEQKHAIQKNATIGTYYISRDMFKALSRFEVKNGDIIMSCSGTIGEFYEIPNGAETGIMNQALLKFTLNSLIHKSYFLYTMEWVKENFEKKGSGLQNIGSVKTIKETSISVPPLTLQQEFAAKIEAIEKQKELVKQSLAETETLFNSRMDYYFN